MDKILRFLIIFLGTYLVLMLIFPPEEKSEQTSKNDIEITVSDETPTVGDLISISVQNNTNNPIDLGTGTPPQKVQIEKYENGEWNALFISESSENLILDPNTSKVFEYPEVNTQFFGTEGIYRIKIDHEGKDFFTDITIEEAGFFKSIWRTFFWKPIYNGLIFSLDITAKDLGLAIILLTIVIKILLFFPTHAGMRAQRKTQKLQPELEKIKTRNTGNQQKIALETVELWKKHKVNPLSSIFPILLQFPVLIALFYVIQNGLSPEKLFFLYSPLAGFDYSGINNIFGGFLPLLQTPLQHLPSLWLPLAGALLQYYAMKLALAKQNTSSKNSNGQGFLAEFQKMQGVMVYILPALVFVFAVFMPSAVGLYMLISTLFTIGQQYFVNKIIEKE